MGLSASKRVEKTLQDSPEFVDACDSTYEECLGMSQHAFPGVRPYQLADASIRLHLTLSGVLPLVKKWVPSPPTQLQVDRAFKVVVGRSKDPGDGDCLDSPKFKTFAVELFTDAIVCNARNAVLRRVPIGIAGIAGIGLATRSGKDLLATVMGVYSVGVAAAVYLSLSG